MLYTREDLERFIIALDAELNTKNTIIIIGGAAATLHYLSKGGTIDIDTYNSIEKIKEAYRRTLSKYPELRVSLSAAVPAQGPLGMQERLQNYDKLPLKYLEIKVPEPHDWILMKTVRCDEKDIADIIELGKKMKLDPDILIERFKDEMLPQNPGNDVDLINSYPFMISVLFNEKTAIKHQRALAI